MSGLPDDWQSWERLPGEPDNWDEEGDWREEMFAEERRDEE